MRLSELLARSFALYKSMPTTGDFAQNAKGAPVDVLSDDVCKVCSMGAVQRVLQDRGSSRLYFDAMSILNHCTLSLVGQGSIIGANDSVDMDTMEAIWNAAIVKAKETEGCEVGA